MKHIEITVTTNSQSSELVAYFMSELCYDGVSIHDPSDLLIASWDYVDENLEKNTDPNVYVKGCCALESSDSVVAELKAKLATIVDGGTLTIATNEVDDTEWLDNWRKYFQPIDFGSIVICPSWIELTDETRPVLLLDNGASFGTGQHETTRMCLKLLADLTLANCSLVDVGCGSGILALSALLLGAEKATLVDIDEMCCDTAVSNSVANKLSDRCEVLCGNLTEKVNGTFDIVMANLTADILYLLACDIATTMHNGTKVVLSGILTDRVHKVIDCYEKIGCKLIKHIEDGEWSALLMEYQA